MCNFLKIFSRINILFYMLTLIFPLPHLSSVSIPSIKKFESGLTIRQYSPHLSLMVQHSH